MQPYSLQQQCLLSTVLWDFSSKTLYFLFFLHATLFFHFIIWGCCFHCTLPIYPLYTELFTNLICLLYLFHIHIIIWTITYAFYFIYKVMKHAVSSKPQREATWLSFYLWVFINYTENGFHYIILIHACMCFDHIHMSLFLIPQHLKYLDNVEHSQRSPCPCRVMNSKKLCTVDWEEK